MLKHEVYELVQVEFIPEELEPKKIYVSEKHNVSQHICPCGCGNTVVLTLIPEVGWCHSIIEGGFTVMPSIGSYDLDCKSHYYIRRNQIVWL